MELKYSVVSSNSNPEYLDFWPYVAKAWKNLIELEPVLLYIDKDSPPEWVYDHGKVLYFQSIEEWDIVQQSQCIRFWAAKVLDAPFIISDMDMLPISKDYYLKNSESIGDKGIISYSSDVIKYRWYKTNPQYPMCYISGDPGSFINILDLNDSDHKSFLRRLMNMRIRSGTDQKFFYNQSIKNNKCSIKHLERGWIEEKYATARLDKVIWPKPGYNADEYIDCHLPRPFSSNAGICKELFNKLKID
jgi:hypothetical protein